MGKWLALVVATLSLAGCISTSPAPTVIVPQGAAVVCPNGSPAAYSNGAYHC